MKRSPIQFFRASYGHIHHENWDALFKEKKLKNLFYHPTIIAAARLVGSKYQPNSVIAGYNGEELVLLQPVKTKNQGFGKIVEILMMPRADNIEPLVQHEQREETLRAFADYIKMEVKPDLLIARSVSEEFYLLLSECFSDHDIKNDGTRQGAFLELPATMDEFLGSFKSNFRNQIKRKVKKGLETNLTHRVVHVDNLPEGYDLRQALDKLTELHSMRFDSINRDSFFTKPAFQKFHQQLCENHNEQPYRLIFTELLHEGEVVGSMYGIRSEHLYVFLMIGFDPKFADYSPGNLLIYYTIEDLIKHKVNLFDFKCGEELYKKRWSKNYYTKYDVAISFTLKGEILYRLHHSNRLLHKLREKAGRSYRKVRSAFTALFFAISSSFWLLKARILIHELITEFEGCEFYMTGIAS